MHYSKLLFSLKKNQKKTNNNKNKNIQINGRKYAKILKKKTET